MMTHDAAPCLPSATRKITQSAEERSEAIDKDGRRVADIFARLRTTALIARDFDDLLLAHRWRSIAKSGRRDSNTFTSTNTRTRTGCSTSFFGLSYQPKTTAAWGRRDQSIYRWRTFLMSFSRDYAAARIIKLELNTARHSKSWTPPAGRRHNPERLGKLSAQKTEAGHT